MALLEDGVVSEIFIEREAHRGIVGNIYKGRVTRVLPGMQSAFVDLGLERDAFLYVADVLEELDENLLTPEEQAAPPRRQRRPRTPPSRRCSSEGQDVLVQVVKEPLGQKGARITSHVSLPGRYLVFMPTVEHVGVSRKIVDDEERRRLKTLLKEIRAGARRRRLHRPHRGAGAQPRGLRARRALPDAAPGTRCARVPSRERRARPAAPRAGARAAAAARPALRRHRHHPPRQRARVPAHAGPGERAAARAGAARAPVRRRRRTSSRSTACPASWSARCAPRSGWTRAATS